MCKVIEFENILSNYFHNNKDKKRVTFSSLNTYKRFIEREFKNRQEFVVIDFTRSSLANAITRNPDIFERNEDSISLRNYETLEKYMAFFNSKLQMPNRVKQDYLKFMALPEESLITSPDGIGRKIGR